MSVKTVEHASGLRIIAVMQRFFTSVIAVLSTALVSAGCADSHSAGTERLRRAVIAAYPAASPAVLERFLSLDRGRLLGTAAPVLLYEDRTVPIGLGQVASRPSVVVRMTQELRVEPGMRVLEVGTGSGVQAALLASLGARVCSIERHLELVRRTKERFRGLGFHEVEIRQGDGSAGWAAGGADNELFDRILVTCAAAAVPPALAAQLVEGGLLIMPLGDPLAAQRLTRFVKRQGRLVLDADLGPVAFVPLVPARP